MGHKVDVSRERPSVRKRAAAAANSERAARHERHARSAEDVLDTERAGFLRSEGPLERTTTVRQATIRASVDRAAAARGSFELDLKAGKLTPYTVTHYSRSGRSLLLASEKGHVALMEWRAAKLRAEIFANETVRDAVFLHSDKFFAVAQRRYAYIYDNSGLQVHVLREHKDPGRLAFLPHHLLLASASCPTSEFSRIVYTDTTSGHEVARHDFGARKHDLGAVSSLCTNLANGVVHAAHSNGVVSLWGPMSGTPLARLFAQRGGVRHLAVDPSRNVMATLGHEGTLKEYDLRTFRPVAETTVTPLATSMTYSQRSLLAVCGGSTVNIWDARKLNEGGKPYMSERYHGLRPTALDFCPYEDALAVCHRDGMCTMLVPGAGEAVFDSSAPNPYMTRKQAREAEVSTMLDRLPPETIALDTGFIGAVDENPVKRAEEARLKELKAEAAARVRGMHVNRAKGRNKISKRVKRAESHRKQLRKATNEIVRKKRLQVMQLTKRIKEERRKEENESGADSSGGCACGGWWARSA